MIDYPGNVTDLVGAVWPVVVYLAAATVSLVLLGLLGAGVCEALEWAHDGVSGLWQRWRMNRAERTGEK